MTHHDSDYTMPAHHYSLPAVADDLEHLRSAAHKCIGDIERAGEAYFTGHEKHRADWEHTWQARECASRDHLAHLISSLAIRIEIYSDAIRIPSIGLLMRQWRKRWPESSWRNTKPWTTPEADGVFSEALSSLESIIDGIMVLVRPTNAPPIDPAIRRSHEHLEHALRSLPKLCRDRQVKPKREMDLQEVLHSHLEGIFPDYTRQVVIPKPIVSFKPDGGVLSLKSAIECKFVSSEIALKQAIHGLTEDLSGYSGSADWTRFYTICYMTAAFAVEGQLQAALGASGNSGAWKVIVVTGAGGRDH